MYSATFIFDIKQFDEDFYELEQEIANLAKQTVGYLGEDTWENADTGRIGTIYYWESMDGLQQLMKDQKHMADKISQFGWLNGYHIVVSRVLHTYGDGVISHPTTAPVNC